MEISADGTHYVFHSVDTQWHDGKPFTSKDVQFTLAEVSAKYGAKFVAAASHIKRIDTPDAHTVAIELDRPFGPFLFSLSGYTNAVILPEHLFAGTDVLKNPATLSSPVGTGPFMLKEWERGQQVRLVRNPAYWRAGRPYLDEVIFREIPDPAARVLALKAGEVDYIYFYFFPLSSYSDIVHNPRIQIRERGVPEDHILILNVRKPPFDNVTVRQALFTALDREYIQKVVYLGLGEVQESAINSRLTWACNPKVNLSRLYPFNPEKAKAMLDGVGFKPNKDGNRFELRLVYDSTQSGDNRLAQVLQSMWRAIGVKLVFEGRHPGRRAEASVHRLGL